MIPTILYARQSRYRGESESIPTQIEVCSEAASRLGLEIVATLTDKVSAYKRRGLDRPDWGRLLDMVRQGEAKAVLVYKSERLSRGGGPGWAPLIEAAEGAGLDLDRLVATPQGFMSEFEIGIRATMDREEAKKIGSRMADLQAKAAKAGRPHGGKRAWGFEADRVTHHPTEAAEIRQAVARILAGDSLCSVAKDVGKKPQVVRQALLSPRLAGLRTHHQPVRDAAGQVARCTRGAARCPGCVTVDATWDPILDQDTWESVCAVLRGRKRQPFTPSTSGPFTFLLRCGRCGGKVQADKGRKLRRYSCEHGDLSRAAEPVEDYLLSKVLMHWEARPTDRPEDPALSGAVRGYEARLAEIEAQMAEPGAPVAVLARAYQDVEGKLAEAQVKLDVSVVASVPVPPDAVVAWGGEEWVDDRLEAWLQLTRTEQRAVVASVLTEVVVVPVGKGRRTFNGDTDLRLTFHPDAIELADDDDGEDGLAA